MPIDMASISALVTSLRSAVEIAKAMKDLHEESAIRGKVIELQTVIMTAQASALAAQADQFALLEQVRDLKKRIAEMEDWQAEKQKYELKQVFIGCIRLRAEARDAERRATPLAMCSVLFIRAENLFSSIMRDIMSELRHTDVPIALPRSGSASMLDQATFPGNEPARERAGARWRAS
jgi:hypothetical protein